jgi:hypothetical protein
MNHMIWYSVSVKFRFIRCLLALVTLVTLAGVTYSSETVKELHLGDVISKNDLLDTLSPTAAIPQERPMAGQADIKVSSVRVMKDGGGQSVEENVIGVLHSSTGPVDSQVMRVTIARPESGKYRVLWFADTVGTTDRYETPREVQLGQYHLVLVRHFISRTGVQEDLLFSMNSDRDLVLVPIENASVQCAKQIRKTETAQNPVNEYVETRATFWFPVMKKTASHRAKPRAKIVGDLEMKGSFERDASGLKYVPEFTVKAANCRRALVDNTVNAHP